MCRWLVYFGDRMVPANLLYYAEHALIKQSGGMKWFCLIFALTVMAIVLFFLIIS